ncbi:MAG: hypothetical protein NZ483_00405 [Verrucomicrobiae bacterium]|nr:hypothetical protein [Verrucomicrobiae bacterium]MDW8343039.1 hypothetical protein [Verrucomicrobiae bacterium]
MAAKQPLGTQSEATTISARDIFFECPACNKSLVVDESAEGLMVECPQCHINVIVPPKSSSVMPPPPSPETKPPARPSEPTPSPAAHDDLMQRLNTLAAQLREQQTQWAEVTNRIASHINDVNRELVILGRLETRHKQLLQEWNQLVAEFTSRTTPTVPTPPTASGAQ